MFQPMNGDLVTVTRSKPGGTRPSSTWRGVISNVGPTGGFVLTGTDPSGYPVCSNFSSSRTLLALYGVTQTITPAN